MKHFKHMVLQVMLLIGIVFFVSCNKQPAGSEDQSSTSSSSTANRSDSLYLPEPSDTLFFNLVSQTDYIDIIFHTLPISISMDKTPDIRRFFAFFDADPLTIASDCNPNATITFLKEGNILAESQLYFSTTCRGLAFTDNQVPVSGVPMNMNGMRYFSNIIQQGRMMFEKKSQEVQ